MVIKGKSCGHAKKLAQHLMRTDQNELIDILELDETYAAPTIEAALLEFQTLADHLTDAKHGLYEASLSPRDNETLTPGQWEQAVDILAEHLGLAGQPRIVILHQKKGREHVHAVFQRTDTDNKVVISDSFNYPAHEQAAREIEQTFGLEKTIGAHTREKDELRPEQAFSREDHQRAERSGIDAVAMKEQIASLYEEADTGRAFVRSLEENGFYLARGDKKNIFMVIDPQLETHKLSSTLKGIRMSEVKAMLHPLTTANFETVDTCKKRILEQSHIKDEAEQLKTTHVDQMEALSKDHKLACDRLEARHYLDNEVVNASRKEIEFTGFLKTIKDAFGFTWVNDKIKEVADRERFGLQAQELQDLKREQLNERTALQRAQRNEWFKLDQENKPESGLRSRFEVARVQKRQNTFEDKMQALRDHDQGSDVWKVITQQLDRLIAHRDKVEYQQNYLETLEFSVAGDFSAIFRDGEKALENFRAMAAETSIKKATKALARRPDQFGLIQDASLKTIKGHIESAVLDASKTHYLKTKVENAVLGLELPGAVIIKLQKEKVKYIQAVPDEKLAMLRDVQLAANNLDDKQRKALEPEAKHAITQARTLMKDRLKRNLADEILKKQRAHEEHERKRQLDLRREIDPPM